MSRRTKRIIGNISVLTTLVALIAVLVFAATSPDLLKNDAKLTAEANEGTPIVQAMATPTATPTPIAPDKEPRGSQERADRIMNLFLASYGRSSIKDFSEGTPHRSIKEWYLKADNKSFVIVLKGTPSTFRLANDFIERVHEQADIAQVTVLDKDNYGATRTIADVN